MNSDLFQLLPVTAAGLGGGGGMSAGGLGDVAAGGVGVLEDLGAAQVDHAVVVGAQEHHVG